MASELSKLIEDQLNVVDKVRSALARGGRALCSPRDACRVPACPDPLPRHPSPVARL